MSPIIHLRTHIMGTVFSFSADVFLWLDPGGGQAGERAGVRACERAGGHTSTEMLSTLSDRGTSSVCAVAGRVPHSLLSSAAPNGVPAIK